MIKCYFAVCLLIAGRLAVGQLTVPKDNRYEVVSIKPGIPGARYGQHISPDEVRLDSITLAQLVLTSYGVSKDNLIGLPAWAFSETYNLDGKSAKIASPGQQWAMWRAVVEDRFGLKFHRESRYVSTFELVTTSAKIDFPATAPGTCETLDPNNPPTGLDPNGKYILPSNCRLVLAQQLPNGVVDLKVNGVDMKRFAGILAAYLERPVFDHTNSTTLFDVHLKFEKDRAGGPSDASDTPSGFPSLRDAVKKVGLSLRSARGPVSVMVIDHVNRPAGN